MAAISRKLFPTLLSLALLGAIATLSRCSRAATAPGPSDGVPDPTLLPKATGQTPDYVTPAPGTTMPKVAHRSAAGGAPTTPPIPS